MLTWIVAALILPLLLYLPGWAVLRAFGHGPTDSLERHYERVVVSALWSGWLALALAALGSFSLILHLALTLALSAGGFLLPRRQIYDPAGVGRPSSLAGNYWPGCWYWA